MTHAAAFAYVQIDTSTTPTLLGDVGIERQDSGRLTLSWADGHGTFTDHPPTADDFFEHDYLPAADFPGGLEAVDESRFPLVLRKVPNADYVAMDVQVQLSVLIGTAGFDSDVPGDLHIYTDEAGNLAASVQSNGSLRESRYTPDYLDNLLRTVDVIRGSDFADRVRTQTVYVRLLMDKSTERNADGFKTSIKFAPESAV